VLNLQAEILLHKGKYAFGILKLVEVRRRVHVCMPHRVTQWTAEGLREGGLGRWGAQALRVCKEHDMVPLFMSQVTESAPRVYPPKHTGPLARPSVRFLTSTEAPSLTPRCVCVCVLRGAPAVVSPAGARVPRGGPV
jgi:hypothetical protein